MTRKAGKVTKMLKLPRLIDIGFQLFSDLLEVSRWVRGAFFDSVV